MSKQIPAAVLSLWQSGHKIEAIKQLREQTGLGLKESKDLLESTDEMAPGEAGSAMSKDKAMLQLREKLDQMGMQDARQLLDQLNQSNTSGGSTYTSIKRVSTTINGKTTTTVTASGDHAEALEMLLSGAAAVPDDVKAQIEEAVARGNKMEAITLLRDATGLGLGQAKDHIDAAMDGIALDWQTLQQQAVRVKAKAQGQAQEQTPPHFQTGAGSPGEVPRSQGWFVWLLVLALAGMGLWYYLKSA